MRRSITRKSLLLGLGSGLVALVLTVRFGNTVILFCESGAPSRSFGARDAGRLEHGKRLPSRGDNFETYSYLGSLLGRNAVHDKLRATILDAYADLRESRPDLRFVLGETGWPSGGPFPPHKTHQHGLSVDFMVPVRDAGGASAALPCRPWNRFGYGLEFDAKARHGPLVIDFEAIALHLLALERAGKRHGVTIGYVIFDPRLQPLLFGTETGRSLARLRFSEKRAWVRHDEHYHVDFGLE